NYQDGITRPSFVYDSGKEVVRRKVLNLGSLDGRIITDWFIKSDGTRTNPSGREDLPSGSKATCGSSWDLALSATGLYNLLNANGDADLRKAQAARLDGATLHFANGTYTVPEMVLNGTGYGENVNLTMYGGYPTTNTGTSTSGRSTNNHLTVISGNKANRIFDMGANFEVTMDNFELTGGKVDGSTATGDAGAIQMLGTTATDCKLTVNQVWFYDNYVENQPDGAGSGIGSGGAIALKRGMLTATNSIFEKGSARNAGGVLVGGQSGTNKAVASFTSCQFKDNETQTNCGAGFSGNGGQITFTDCTFTSNVAACYGGGVHWDPTSSPSASLSMTNCTFTSNSTIAANGSNGGGFSCQSGTATLSGCTFTSNATGLYGTKGAGGGAIWAQGTVNASDCTFTGNSGTKGGGAIWVSSTGTLNLTGTNTFSGNFCTSYVNGSSQTVYGQGGAICTNGGTTTIAGSTTFQQNYAVERGGAICCNDGTNLTIENSGENRPLFSRNYTTTEVAAAGAYGAGIYIPAKTGTIALTGVDFDANYFVGGVSSGSTTVYSEGGAIACNTAKATNLTLNATSCTFTNTVNDNCLARNGAVLRINVSKSNAGTLSFTECAFTNNRSYNVGAVTSQILGEVTFTDCDFTDNIADAFSGVHHINNEDASATFDDCTFERNSLTSTNVDHGYGSVCRIEAGEVTMISCTLTGNTSAGLHGGVIALNDGKSTLNLKGSTIEGNTYTNATKTNILGGAIYYGGGTLNITSSDGTSSGTKSVIRANTGCNGNGYGLYVASGLTPSLSYCTFDAQNSGGTVSPTSLSEDSPIYAIYYAGTNGDEELSMTGCEIKNFDRQNNEGLWWTNLLDATNHTTASTLSFDACTFEGLRTNGNGAVFEYYTSSPFVISSIEGCTFKNNYSYNNGGAIYTQTDLEATNCIFTGNQARQSGGAIYIKLDVPGHGDAHEGFFDHSVSSHGAKFTSNTAKWGGAVYVDSGKYLANNAEFTSNTATTSDATYIQGGGAVYLNAEIVDKKVKRISQGTFNDCVFTGNSSPYGYGGAVVQFSSVSQFNRCTFTGNSATRRGGALFATLWGFVYINNSKFIGNSLTHTSDTFGSAMAFTNHGWVFANGLLVAENVAPNSSGDQSSINGATRALLTNCTLLGKITKSGSAVYRIEASYGKIFHSLILPTDDATVRNSVTFGTALTETGLKGYYSVFDGILETASNWKTPESCVTGKHPADLGNYSWDSTDKMYSWDGTVSGYSNYDSLSAMWTAVAGSFTGYESIPAPGDNPEYKFFETAPLGSGLAKTFLDWLDVCGGGTAGDGVGRNKDILGYVREDAKNYPGCRAY
nr:hypothetical protein [Bacteroidales bacterium]